MLSVATREELAAELADAERSRVPMAPLTAIHSDIDVVDAYEIQLINIRQRVAEGARVVGHKVGLSESAALFAVVAGGKLLGFVGVLLAVPIAATVAVLLRHAVRAYEHSEFFGQESDAAVSVTRAMKTILPDRRPTAPIADAAAAGAAAPAASDRPAASPPDPDQEA